MKKSYVLWLFTFLLTIGSAIFQRITGPTYPVSGKFTLGEKTFRYKFERSHSSNSPLVIQIEIKNPEVTGNVYWKRFRVNEDYTVVKMVNENGILKAEIPPQPPAGKIEYRVELFDKNSSVLIPENEFVVLRFKNDVPVLILIPHIIFIFLSMLYSTRSGLEYFNSERNYKKYINLTILFLILGGFIFGPLVQYYAFGVFWSGIPFGIDLTDNKTLIALLFWLIAYFKFKKSETNHKWILIAAIVMFIIFLIPHSLLGSELDYSKVN